jgi:hypothetical protein
MLRRFPTRAKTLSSTGLYPVTRLIAGLYAEIVWAHRGFYGILGGLDMAQTP